MSKFNYNLLNICHSYNRFEKIVIDSNSEFFNKSYVIVRINKIEKLATLIPVFNLRRIRSKKKIDLQHIKDNVKLYKSKICYLPGNNQYKKVGKKHFESVKEIISRNNINFDIIHSQFLWSAGYVGSQLKNKYNVPFIVNARGYDIYDLPFRDKDWLKKISNVLFNADHVITVSKKNLNIIKGINKNIEVSVIPNGINTNYFYPQSKKKSRKKLNLPSNKKIITFIGNLKKVKGIPYLIIAIKKLAKIREDFYLFILGNGIEYHNIKKQIKKLDLENKVFLQGQIKHHLIPIWINASDAIVLSSLNEGNPNVMFEALACGKPFIGTDVGGIRDIIKNNNIGYVVPPRNSENLKIRINDTLEKEWNRDQILKYAKKFSLVETKKQYHKLFNQLLEKY